jgi:clan AA aspartic protease (TIGR02281 family)
MREFDAAWLLPAVLIALLSLTTPSALASSDFDRGVKLYAQRDYKNANICFEQAVRDDPKNATALYYKALSLHQSGDLNAAVQCYSGICASFPGTPEAKNAAQALAQTKGVKTSSSNSATGSASATVVPVSKDIYERSNVGDEELASLPEQGSVPFSRGPGGHIMITAYVNNRAMQVIFDTGASLCLFGQNHLDAAGVTGAKLTGEKSAVGGVGNTATPTLEEIVSIRVGNITRTMPVSVCAKASLPPLLGETFYNGYYCDIDSSAGVIRFTKKTSKRRYSSTAYDTINIPYETMGNNLVVLAKVNGASCPMIFDTGAGGVVFSYSQAVSIGLHIPRDARTVVNSGVGGMAGGYRFEVDQLEVGPIRKTHVPVDVLMSGGPPLGLLGQSFLSDRRFTIDYDTHQIRFSR